MTLGAVGPSDFSDVFGYSLRLVGHYAITADITGLSPQQTVRGFVILNGKGESIIGRMWRQVAKVLVREAGA